LSKSAYRSFVMRHPTLLRLREEVLDPDMETILHLSPTRLKWLGIFTLIGHPLFWYVWTALLPQPYESITARLLIASLGIGLFYIQPLNGLQGTWTQRYFSFACWLQLPVFAAWMYWMNGGGGIWLATMATMIVIYYQLTDWRLASVGVVAGGLFATLLATIQLNGLPQVPLSHAVVVLFSLFSAVSLGASSANMRRERIRHSLVVIGIMAHELRTPVATMSLIGQAIRNEATNTDGADRSKTMVTLASRIESLSRTINQHIDLQMINARFMQLPRVNQLISATRLVHAAVAAYPYSSQRECDCMEVAVHENFWFFGSERQFTQVLNNLIKNALHSLKAAQSKLAPGDVRIEIGMKGDTGKITVTDQGMGINAHHLQRIFEPFFSTSTDTGHGLGLAYCQQVVQTAGGFIRVKSEPAFGAIFTIDLPVQKAPSPDTPPHALSSVSPT
jgi:two-component system, CAI-1 autoinducer sensor kinase/phosphatase CqsS